MGKSVTQISTIAYNEQQFSIRNMTANERLIYAAPGTRDAERRKEDLKASDERRKYRADAIAKFDEDRPIYGNIGNVSDEMLAEIQALSKEFNEKRRRFLKKLDSEFPALVI